ncbi:MAG: sulfite exporter TauE/SafE family protein [Myxococcota bacterium]|nr:sulfite exporter TauE/SafE family protein [Myxococcota bacterium]
MMVALLTVAAFATAVISGMTGLGGGTILVVILYAAGLAPSVAVPVHASVQLVSNGARLFFFLKHVRWSALGFFMLTALPAPFLVADSLSRLDPNFARIGMGLFILLVTWTSGLKRWKLQGPGGMMVAGALAGGLGMVVGATGTLIAPFFLRPGWTKETVIGTKALCQASAHVVKLVAFSTVTFAFGDHLDLIGPMALAVVGGAYTGKRAVGALSEDTFRRVFKGLLTGLALWLIIRAALRLGIAHIAASLF